MEEKEKDLRRKKAKECSILSDKEEYFGKILFISLFLQPIAFLISMYYIILFAVINLS